MVLKTIFFVTIGLSLLQTNAAPWHTDCQSVSSSYPSHCPSNCPSPNPLPCPYPNPSHCPCPYPNPSPCPCPYPNPSSYPPSYPSLHYACPDTYMCPPPYAPYYQPYQTPQAMNFIVRDEENPGKNSQDSNEQTKKGLLSNLLLLPGFIADSVLNSDISL